MFRSQNRQYIQAILNQEQKRNQTTFIRHRVSFNFVFFQLLPLKLWTGIMVTHAICLHILTQDIRNTMTISHRVQSVILILVCLSPSLDSRSEVLLVISTSLWYSLHEISFTLLLGHVNRNRAVLEFPECELLVERS